MVGVGAGAGAGAGVGVGVGDEVRLIPVQDHRCGGVVQKDI